ncbi:MAG: hypothetical protein NTZ90_11415 [Proteobacteria bacterium]|nr:hypothetical protein [Pseudomonadota bacterium]
MPLTQPTHLVLTRPGYANLLIEEFQDRWQLSGTAVGKAAVTFNCKTPMPALDESIFARQYLPMPSVFQGSELQPAVEFLIKKITVMSKRANRQSGRWTLHTFAVDDDGATKRAIALEKSLLTAIKTSLPTFYQRHIAAADLAKETPQSDDILVQVFVASEEELWLSLASFASTVSPYIGGNLRMRERSGAPSRSARKLEEAFVELGRSPAADELAVDLGAAPGGWTFTLARHGALVTAVDHGSLDLPKNPAISSRVTHLRKDGLTYKPAQPVDWLCCDMLVGSRETLRILGEWLEQQLMQCFVVNVKLPQSKPWPIIMEALDLLQRQGWPVMKIKHLYHDRREVTLMGRRIP